MKIAILTHKPRSIDIDKLFISLRNEFIAASICSEADFLIIDVPKSDCKKLKPFIKNNNLQEVDVVILDIPFKYLYKQSRQVNKLKKIWIYEEDACQNFLPHSKWYKKFSQFYKKLNNASIISTGNFVSQRMNELGYACHFLPKGFNSNTLYQLDSAIRNIPLGFIGTLHSNVYIERKKTLETLSEKLGLQCFRTQSIDEYRDKLNDMKIFFSADIGLEEYMCKNFEAMACGCVLVAYRQGNGEEEALGLKDMENCVLYSSIEEAITKIQALLSNDQQLETISTAGREHALQNFDYTKLGKQLTHIMQRGF